MTQSDGKPLNDKIEVLWKFSSNLLKTIPPLRAVGYGLLFLSMLDLLTIILPPQLMNPVWEFQTMGGLWKGLLFLSFLWCLFSLGNAIYEVDLKNLC
ncbi:hypothetical protein APLC1_4353 [Limnospira platensis C1]|nr:hypothetical protein APLC1_4353 [Arthrospira platensis C1]